MAVILGIDPGLQKTGWGVVSSDGNRLRFIGSGTIRSDSKAMLSDRLITLHHGMVKVLEAYVPDVCAVEETFLNSNARSSLKLGHARGVLMMTASLHHVPVREYAATLVKKSIVGAGRAEKQQVQMMIKQLLPQSDAKTEDEADALAVAICHLHHGHIAALAGV